VNRLDIETTNCAGSDAEPPRSALSLHIRTDRQRGHPANGRVASLGREWQLTGDDFITTNFGFWPGAAP
jgi:hypothetical protein